MPTDFPPMLQNPPLFKAILAFNGLGKAPADESLPPALAADIEKTRLWRQTHRRATPTGLWCFEALENRLALLPFVELEKLFGYWNALVLADLLRQTIDGRRLAALKPIVGGEAYRFALDQGWRFPQELRVEFSPPKRSAPDEIRLRQPGRQLAALCFALWPEPLRVRWRARHAGKDSVWFAPPLIEGQKSGYAALFRRVWPWLSHILYTETAPQWEPCFNS
jgi:hypothetical protein